MSEIRKYYFANTETLDRNHQRIMSRVLADMFKYMVAFCDVQLPCILITGQNVYRSGFFCARPCTGFIAVIQNYETCFCFRSSRIALFSYTCWLLVAFYGHVIVSQFKTIPCRCSFFLNKRHVPKLPHPQFHWKTVYLVTYKTVICQKNDSIRDVWNIISRVPGKSITSRTHVI